MFQNMYYIVQNSTFTAYIIEGYLTAHFSQNFHKFENIMIKQAYTFPCFLFLFFTEMDCYVKRQNTSAQISILK